MEEKLIEKLYLLAEANGKTFDSCYSATLNGNFMMLYEQKRQIKFTHCADREGALALATAIIEEMKAFEYEAKLVAAKETNSPIYEYVIEY